MLDVYTAKRYLVELPACRRRVRAMPVFCRWQRLCNRRGGEKSDRVLRYVSRLGRWETVGAAMPEPVANTAWTKKDDLLIVAGGVRRDGRDSKPYRPLTLKLKWSRLAALPQASSGGALGVVDGALHYAGGFSQSRKSFARHVRYNGKVWRDLAAMPQGRHQNGLCRQRVGIFHYWRCAGRGLLLIVHRSNRAHLFTADMPTNGE